MNAHECNELPGDSEVIHLRFDDEVDDLVADDVLGLAPEEIDFLFTSSGEHSVHQIVRGLGTTFYPSLDSQRQIAC